ncbi:MAG: autotransporter adhesin family protein [Synergistaceae bacterium]|nr:autotransporter adhesin family protein [Synergistaceae bacterium]
MYKKRLSKTLAWALALALIIALAPFAPLAPFAAPGVTALAANDGAPGGTGDAGGANGSGAGGTGENSNVSGESRGGAEEEEKTPPGGAEDEKTNGAGDEKTEGARAAIAPLSAGIMPMASNVDAYFTPPVDNSIWKRDNVVFVTTQTQFYDRFIFFPLPGQQPPWVGSNETTFVLEDDEFLLPSGTINVGTAAGSRYFRFIVKSKLTIGSGSSSALFAQGALSTIIIEDGGELVIEYGGQFNSASSAVGGAVTGDQDKGVHGGVRFNGITVRSGGKLTISGGEFNLAENVHGHTDAIVIESGGTVEYNTGSFTMKNNSVIDIQKGGKLYVNGRIVGERGVGQIVNAGEVHFGTGGSLAGVVFDDANSDGKPPEIEDIDTLLEFDPEEEDAVRIREFTTADGSDAEWKIVYNPENWQNPPKDLLVPPGAIVDGEIALLPTLDHVGKPTPYKVTARNEFGSSAKLVLFTVYSELMVLPQENTVFRNLGSENHGVAEFTLIAPGISSPTPYFGLSSPTATFTGGDGGEGSATVRIGTVTGTGPDYRLPITVESATVSGTYTIGDLWLSGLQKVPEFDLVISPERKITISQAEPAAAGVRNHPILPGQVVEFDVVTSPGAFEKLMPPHQLNNQPGECQVVTTGDGDSSVLRIDPVTGLGKMPLYIPSSMFAPGDYSGITLTVG